VAVAEFRRRLFGVTPEHVGVYKEEAASNESHASTSGS